MNKLGTSRMLRVACVSMLMIGIGCGDDDADDSPGAGGRAGRTGESGSAANSGRGATSGNGGSVASNLAGTGVVPGATDPVQCGANTCTSPGGGFGGFISACCADEATSTCGMSMGGPCAKPVASDSRCPGLNVMGFTLPSCCGTDDMCGIDASMFGMPGCIELGKAAQQAMSMGGASADIPPPRSCEGSESDAGTDAGSE
jgi:hypothetical protein